jgi:polyphenol oxidase
MNILRKKGVTFFQLPFRDPRCFLSHAFFSRCGGVSPPPYSSLNTAPLSGDNPPSVEANIARIANILGAPPSFLVAARQVHGSRVVRVSSENIGQSIFSNSRPFRADALVTDQEGIWLGILTADCLPVLFFDPERRVIGAAHAGWRGTLKRIAVRTLQAMVSLYHCRPEDLWAGFGPAIGPCCYEVGDEVVDAFLGERGWQEPGIRRKTPGRWTLSLAAINRRQLLEGGMISDRILSSPLCTKCRPDLFFSVRAQGEPTGRQLSVIGMKAKSKDTGHRTGSGRPVSRLCLPQPE